MSFQSRIVDIEERVKRLEELWGISKAAADRATKMLVDYREKGIDAMMRARLASGKGEELTEEEIEDAKWNWML